MRSFLLGLIWVVACFTAGCGGSSSSVNNGTVNKITIDPNPIYLKPTEAIQLTAILDGGSAPIDWDVNSINGGFITTGGIYHAPEASGTYEVQVSLASNHAIFGKANAIVDSKYVVSVFTSTSQTGPFTVTQGGTLQLFSKVTGAASNLVNWYTTGGSISPDGILSAPSTPGTITVTAVCASDQGKSVDVQVNVVP